MHVLCKRYATEYQSNVKCIIVVYVSEQSRGVLAVILWPKTGLGAGAGAGS